MTRRRSAAPASSSIRTAAGAGTSSAASRWRCSAFSPARNSSSASSAIRRASRPARCTASAISSSRRGCRSSCGAASRTISCSIARAQGTLHTPAVLEQQVRRMLADPKAEALVDELRRPVALPAQPEEHAAELGRVSRFRRQPAAGVRARSRAVLRQHRARGPQRARSDDRRLHVRERAAREALRHPERLRQPVPARHADRRRRGAGCSARAPS